MTRTSLFRQFAVRARDSLATGLRYVPGTSEFVGPPRHEITNTVAAVRAQNNGSVAVRELSPERAIQRSAASHLDPAMAARFEAMKSGAIKPRFVAEFTEGRYWGRGYGYVIGARDTLYRDLSPCFEDYEIRCTGAANSHDALKQPWLPRVRRSRGTFAAIGTPFCDNFHHWLLDTVPKFGLLQDAGWDWGDFDGFVIPAVAQKTWHRQIWERLGIPTGKVIAIDAGTQIEAERLVVPSYSEPGREPEKYEYTPEGIVFIRALFANNASTFAERPRKILVSRERANCRRWTYADVAYSRLAREGFVKVFLEEHSLSEQAWLFANAQCIVMPTGGGLANLVFCQPGTRIVELFSPAYLPTFSLVLASRLQLDYCALVAESSAERHGHRDEGAADDISVTVDRVLEQLK